MKNFKIGDEVNWAVLKTAGFIIREERKVSQTWRNYDTRQEITARCRNGYWVSYKVTSVKSF